MNAFHFLSHKEKTKENKMNHSMRSPELTNNRVFFIYNESYTHVFYPTNLDQATINKLSMLITIFLSQYPR